MNMRERECLIDQPVTKIQGYIIYGIPRRSRCHVLIVEPHHLPRSEGKVKRVVDRRQLVQSLEQEA